MEALDEIKALSREAAIQKEAERIRSSLKMDELVLNDEQLMALNVPDVEWLVDSMIQNPGFVAISGKPGSYKTFFALWIARRVATGLTLFDKCVSPMTKYFTRDQYYIPKPCRPTGVLFMQEELNPSQSKKRANSLLSFSKENVYHRINAGFKMTNDEHIKELREWCLKKNVKLVFLDPFSSVSGLSDENDNMEAAEMLDKVRAGLINHGITVVIIHHPAKTADGGSTLRGAGDITGKMDTHIRLEKPEKNDSTIIVRFEKTRDIDGSSIFDFRMRYAKDAGMNGRGYFEFIGEFFEEEKKKK